ncbi:Protein of unknown function [Bacillus cereus]|nr:Protein of unknown function [Bacillus cereus]
MNRTFFGKQLSFRALGRNDNISVY